MSVYIQYVRMYVLCFVLLLRLPGHCTLCRKTVSTFTLSKIDNIMRLLLEGEKKVFAHSCVLCPWFMSLSLIGPENCDLVLTAYVHIIACRTADSLTT